MQCAVVIPHPTDPQLVCSAGADGKACLWDLESGKCLFSHQNKVDFGPIEARDRGQISAFLDGSFSPDGTELVLTDDGGRVTILNCVQGSPASFEQPFWMKEQYFANDYYELLYDPDGYCIERGSEQPPHLAPRAVRCSHSGATSGELVNRAFNSLAGPLPLSEYDVCWDRISRRLRMEAPQTGRRVQRGNIVGQYEPGTTTLVSTSVSGKPVVVSSTQDTSIIGHVANVDTDEATSRPQQRSPQLSRNYRWRDNDDALREEIREENDGALDSDDDSFHIETNNAARASRVANRTNSASRTYDHIEDSEESNSDMDIDEMLEDSPAAPPRATSRQSRHRYKDGESSDEDMLEFMSSNNTPSGPFVADYESHHFKLNLSWRVNNAWLCRHESNSSYNGRKSYVPQAGDSVVYIPRAHHETLSEFPSLDAPWQNWPEGSEWPVVRCCIRNVRYRFPYSSYFPRKSGSGQSVCRSVVALLTLELTGISELSSESSQWPKPSFTRPRGSHIFEVGIFECDTTDFIIPLSLYVSRLNALGQLPSQDRIWEVEAFYSKSVDSDDDGFFEPFTGTVKRVQDENAVDAPKLRGSGYQSVLVVWPDDNSETTFSPWELKARVEGSTEDDSFSRPSLNDSEKQTIREAMREILEMGRVKECFFKPVDTQRYSDYERRVEVPMSIDLIKDRLEANYYSNRHSVISDIKLIRDNSFKYNGEFDDLTHLATKMLDKFAKLVLSSDEFLQYATFQEQLEKNAAEGVVGQFEGEDADEEDTATNEPTMGPAESRVGTNAGEDRGAVRRSQRARRSTSSALESLPPPPDQAPLRIRFRMPQRPAGGSSRATRSVLEPAQPPQPPLVALDAGTRGRTTRNSRGQQPSTRQLRSGSSSNADQSAHPDGRLSASERATRSTTRQRQPGTQHARSDISFHEAPQGAQETHRQTRSSRTSVGSSSSDSSEGPPASRREQATQVDNELNENSDADFSDDYSDDSGPESGPTLTTRRSRGASNRQTGRSLLESIGSEAENSERGSRAANRPRRAARDSSVSNGNGSDGSYENQESAESEDAVDDMSDDSDVKMPATRRRGLSGRKSGRRSSRRTRPTRSARDSSPSDDEDSDPDGVAKSRKRTSRDGGSNPNPPRRYPRRRGDGEESESEAGDSPFENEKVLQTRRRNRASRESEEGQASDAPAISIPCNRRRFTRGMQDEDDDDDDEESSESLEAAGRSPSAKRRSRTSSIQDSGNVRSGSRRTSRQQERTTSPNEPQSPRRAAATIKSYVDPSSSEFDSDGHGDDDELIQPPKRKRKARRSSNKSKKPAAKKQKAAVLPEIKEWPDLGLKHITEIGNAILDKLIAKDAGETFAIPVAEAYPDLAESYLETIEQPMDFRTIQEERLPTYGSLHDLQNDLILVFQNCITFNPRKSHALNKLATAMLIQLEDDFREVCEELNILLPRRW